MAALHEASHARFEVIGLNHPHIYGQVDLLLDARILERAGNGRD